MSFEEKIAELKGKPTLIQKSIIVSDEISRTTIEMPTELKVKAKRHCAEFRKSFKDYIIQLVENDLLITK